MKILISSVLFGVTFSFSVNSQLSTSFTCPGSNIIAYKEGTSCTASAYSFYTIDINGTQNPISFYTLADVNKEVNGLGVNPIDMYLYGIVYDRDGSCIFSNFHLTRYDALGNFEDLGLLPPISGGTVSAALGCNTTDGHYIYMTTDASGNKFIAKINDVASLPANASAILSASFKQIINNVGAISYSDWAVHPTNGKIYSYGIQNIGGISTGMVLEINTLTGDMNAVGANNQTDFLDVARDNFGGVYFGTDNMLYGVNINTRMLYQIDVTTGIINYKSTISGASQIRADMGSCTTGYIFLPIEFKNVFIRNSDIPARLYWQMESSSEIADFIIEQKIGNESFKEFGKIHLTSTDKYKTDFNLSIPNSTKATYRIKAISVTGKIIFSASVVYNTTANTGIQLLANPVTQNSLRLTSNSIQKNQAYIITDLSGKALQRGNIITGINTVSTIPVEKLHSGIYCIQLSGSQNQSLMFMMQ